MTQTTENRGYNVPEPGQADWHEPVTENWEAIDADLQTAMEMVEAALEATRSKTDAADADDQH